MALKLVERISGPERIELISMTPTLLESGWKLYSERSDKAWGIVDCISFVVMEQFGINETLTADRHFEQAGFLKLL